MKGGFSLQEKQLCYTRITPQRQLEDIMSGNIFETYAPVAQRLGVTSVTLKEFDNGNRDVSIQTLFDYIPRIPILHWLFCEIIVTLWIDSRWGYDHYDGVMGHIKSYYETRRRNIFFSTLVVTTSFNLEGECPFPAHENTAPVPPVYLLGVGARQGYTMTTWPWNALQP